MGKPTAGLNGVAHRPLNAYESLVRALSDRLVEAQRPIRVLDAIKWDEEVERTFFERGCRELPAITRDYYLSRPLPFDPEQMEVLEVVADSGRPSGEVVEEVRRGYLWKDRVFRYAQVRVAKP